MLQTDSIESVFRNYLPVVDMKSSNIARCRIPIAIGLLSYLTVSAQVPGTFEPLTTVQIDTNAISPGCIFLSSSRQPGQPGPYFLQVVNNDGTIRASKKTGLVSPGDLYFGSDFKVLPNGLLLNAQSTGWLNHLGTASVVDQVLNENLNVVETIQMGNGYQSANQDFELLANGHVLMLGAYTTLADIRSIVPKAAPRAEISGAIIQELNSDRNVVWQWRTWDHFHWDEFGDWDPQAGGAFITGWRVNSVRMDPIDGNVLVGTRAEVMKIDRQSGAVIWRLGGPFNQFTFAGVSQQEGVRQFGGTDFHRLPNGNYILLNPASPDGTRSSQVHEYLLNETTKTATHVWQYLPQTMVTATAGGNVQRLPNGNTLIGWGISSAGSNPECTEVTADGRKVFELSFTNATTDSYRAYRLNYPPSGDRTEATELGLADGNTYNFIGTGVSLQVGTRTGEGYNSATVTREPYAPINPLFQGNTPKFAQIRINFTQTFLENITGQIYFDPASFSITDPANVIVYYRPTAGQGLFVPLNTQYNLLTQKIAAELVDTGFGEFALGMADITEVPLPPSLIIPESQQVGPFITRVPGLVKTGEVYTVNQQLPVALTWNPNGIAAGYALQISTNANFTTTEIDEPFLLEARYTFSNPKPNTTYFWRVNAWNNGGLSDWAQHHFQTIPPFIHLSFPNGGEVLTHGNPFYLQWDGNLAENLTIELYKAASLYQIVVTNVSSATSYEWSIDPSLPTASDYTLKIRNSAGTIYDTSDNPFSIVDRLQIDAKSAQFSDGKFSFTINSPGALQATVFASTNLLSWQQVSTVVLTNGVGIFSDDAAATSPKRFYQVRLP